MRLPCWEATSEGMARMNQAPDAIDRMMDMLSDATRRTRSDYHLTLGDAIDQLKVLPSSNTVRFDWNGLSPNSEHSYRGYYSDLALDWGTEHCTVRRLLSLCERALGNQYMGYKGGDYLMDAKTPLWAALWGDTGRAITGISADGDITILTRELPA